MRKSIDFLWPEGNEQWISIERIETSVIIEEKQTTGSVSDE